MLVTRSHTEATNMIPAMIQDSHFVRDQNIFNVQGNVERESISFMANNLLKVRTFLS